MRSSPDSRLVVTARPPLRAVARCAADDYDIKPRRSAAAFVTLRMLSEWGTLSRDFHWFCFGRCCPGISFFSFFK